MMMLLSEIQKLTDTMDGFLSQNGDNLREGEVLYHLARQSLKNTTIVEIGSWKGKSTIWLGKGSLAGSKNFITAIDPHTGSPEHQKAGEKVWTFEIFKKNIESAGLSHLVHPLIKTSLEGVNDVEKPVGLVFIDGAHDYESVKNDFRSWFPKVAEGGVIAFHDSFLGWPGVRKVVHEEVFKSHYFKKVRYMNAITYGIKSSRVSLKDRLENRINYFVKRTHEMSLSFPQPFRSIIKRLIWRPFQKRWLQELNRIS